MERNIIMKFNIKEWQDKTLNEAVYKGGRGYMGDLKDGYYAISDALDGGHGIYNAIKDIGSHTQGEEWLAKHKIDPIKEAKIFEQIYKLFKQSKLGRVL